MTKRYESVIVFSPDLTDDAVTEQCKKIETLVANHNGRVEKTDIWGRRKLAYKIANKEFGTYVVFVISADGTVVDDLKRQLKINDSVLRSLTVMKDKYAPDFDKARLVDVDEDELAEKIGDIGADPAAAGDAAAF